MSECGDKADGNCSKPSDVLSLNSKNSNSKDGCNNQIKQQKKSGGSKKSNKKQKQRKNNVHSRHKSGSNQLAVVQVNNYFSCMSFFLVWFFR